MQRSIRALVVAILTWEARMTLARHAPKVIAVTGSVGKTTTKDAIHAALAASLDARKSEKSLNSELGVPLTILGLESAWNSPFGWLSNIVKGFARAVYSTRYPAWLVVEVGADRPGDISAIARWIKPDIAVITGVPDMPVHVEYFASAEDVFREKRVLADNLKPGGKLILNGDDGRMKRLHGEFRGAAVRYGLEDGNEFSAREVTSLFENGRPVGMRFRMEHSGSSVPVEIFGTLGLPRVYAALAALAAADSAGVDAVSAAAALCLWKPPPGRVRILDGLKSSLIIDDSYNSSPAAALAALDILEEVGQGKRRIAVLGDMLELGRHAKEAHRVVGERARRACDLLVTVGIRARTIAEAAIDAGMKESTVRQYELGESRRAGKELEAELSADTVVLVKGSQGIRMERAVKEIMAHPERAAEFLVRQEEEWQNR